MLRMLLCAIASMLLGACGGGGGAGDAADGGTPPRDATTQAAPMATVCGRQVGASMIVGTVSGVQDGDTLTVQSAGTPYSIRLDGIDAPELAQPFGPESKEALSAATLGRQVSVAYSKLDRYGRVVGAVFTDTCDFANLRQLATGMAWFYKAYQCELAHSVRSSFAAAQDAAVQARLGLWRQDTPEAPWFHRNGSEPATPVCSGDAPAFHDSAMVEAASTGADTHLPAPAAAPSAATGSPATFPSSTCYVGPRGGTYTLTASGNRNYSGC